MYSQLTSALRRLVSAWAVVLVLALLVPSLALAQSADIPVGTPATVTNTGGDPILVRDTPGYDALVLLPVTEGTIVDIIDGPVTASDGSVWYGVLVSDVPGYIVRDYLTPIVDESSAQVANEVEMPTEAPVEDAAVEPETAESDTVEEPTPAAALQETSIDATATGGTGTAVTTAPLNLRSGPGVANSVLQVIPAGASVSITGTGQSGFLPVSYDGTSGWASAGFLAQGSGPAPSSPGATGTGTTTSPLNFRNGPGTGYGVISVIPQGTSVTLTGQNSGGFLSISFNGMEGWVAADYIATGSPAPAPPPPSQPSPPPATGSATTTTNLHLRSGPSTADRSLTVIPSGATVFLTGQSSNGFLSVSHNGISGWSFADFLSVGSAPAPTPPSTPAPATGTAVTTTNLHLRSGPGTSNSSLTVIPAGTSVSITGSAQNGFLPVAYNGLSGWSSATFLNTGGSPTAPAPAPPSTSTMVTTARLNLRVNSSLSAAVLTVMPSGASVTVNGSAQSGFLPATYGARSGWASADFLTTGGNPGTNPAPGGGGSGIIWPVSGGTWSIIQGYNGGTHQNRSASAQYYYALDIARADGNTAGQSVYAPASGTILWLDSGSGGIAIDMGNGYVIAMFHGTFGGGLGRGQSVSQGQYLGTISGPGGPGYASTPHIDMTLWQSSDGGRTRTAAPYTGANAISGTSFGDTGGANQHGGSRFTP